MCGRLLGSLPSVDAGRKPKPWVRLVTENEATTGGLAACRVRERIEAPVLATFAGVILDVASKGRVGKPRVLMLVQSRRLY